MINYGRIKSSAQPEPKVIDDYSVWINSDVEEIIVSDTFGEHTEYVFTQIRYDKDEYIKMMDDKNSDIENQLTDTQLALCEVYEMIGG